MVCVLPVFRGGWCAAAVPKRPSFGACTRPRKPHAHTMLARCVWLQHPIASLQGGHRTIPPGGRVRLSGAVRPSWMRAAHASTQLRLARRAAKCPAHSRARAHPKQCTLPADSAAQALTGAPGLCHHGPCRVRPGRARARWRRRPWTPPPAPKSARAWAGEACGPRRQEKGPMPASGPCPLPPALPREWRTLGPAWQPCGPSS